MNSGVISSRYAKTLLQLVIETGRGEQVYSQVNRILRDPSILENGTIQLEPDLERFIAFVVSKGRTEYMKYILHSFCSQYNAYMGRKLVRLTTVVPIPGLEEKLRPVLAKALDSEILFETAIDAGLIGGFRVEVEDLLLDASVRRQIDDIKRQFVDNNRRIV